MTTRTLTHAVLAIALAVPAATFAAQPFGRDTVYAASGGTSTDASRSATVRNEAQPYGRDTVSASRLPGSGQPATSTAEIVLRPGRA
jgi:hypothetical protein